MSFDFESAEYTPIKDNKKEGGFDFANAEYSKLDTNDSFIGDMATKAEMGVTSTMQGLSSLVGAEGAADFYRSATNNLKKELSPAQSKSDKEEIAHKVGEGSSFNPFNYDWQAPSARKVSGMLAQSLFGTAAGMGIGGVATKGLAVLGNAVGRGAAAAAVKGGTPLAKQAVKHKGAITGAVGFGIGEGVVGAGMSGSSVFDAVIAMKQEVISQSPEYQSLIDSGIKPHAAQLEIAKKARNQAEWNAGTMTALLGAPMGAVFAGWFGRKAVSSSTLGKALEGATRKGNIILGAAGEGTQEFTQGIAEQVAQNKAIKEFANPNQDIGEGVFENAISGALAGGVMGGAVGSIAPVTKTHLKEAASELDAEKAQASIDNILDPSKTLDESIRAANEATDLTGAGLRKELDALFGDTPLDESSQHAQGMLQKALPAPQQVSRRNSDGTIQQGTEADVKSQDNLNQWMQGLVTVANNEEAISREARLNRKALAAPEQQHALGNGNTIIGTQVSPEGIASPLTDAQVMENNLAQSAQAEEAVKNDTSAANAIHGRAPIGGYPNINLPQGGSDVTAPSIKRANGQPFATEKSANMAIKAKKLTGTHEAQAVEGGYVLAPIANSPAQAQPKVSSVEPVSSEKPAIEKAKRKVAYGVGKDKPIEFTSPQDVTVHGVDYFVGRNKDNGLWETVEKTTGLRLGAIGDTKKAALAELERITKERGSKILESLGNNQNRSQDELAAEFLKHNKPDVNKLGISETTKSKADEQIEQIAQSYAAKLAAKRGDENTAVREMHRAIAKGIINKDAYALKNLANGANKTAKEVFTEATGVNLPKQQGKTWDAILEWAGVDKADDDALQAKHNSERLREKVVSKADEATALWIDKVVSEGFVAIKKHGRETWLTKGDDGKAYNLSVRGGHGALLLPYLKAKIAEAELSKGNLSDVTGETARETTVKPKETTPQPTKQAESVEKAVVKNEQPPKISANKIFTSDAAAEARKILLAGLSQTSAGLDPKLVQAGITLAGYHIESGARTFAAYSKAMVDDLGDIIKPYLKQFYMNVKFDPRATDLARDMDSAASVEAAIIDNTDGKKEVEHERNDAGTKGTVSADDDAEHNQPRVPVEEQGLDKQEGRSGSKSGIQTGQNTTNAAIPSGGGRDGLQSENQGLVGHKADEQSKRDGERTSSEHGILSGDSRKTDVRDLNYNLEDSPNIALTPAKRRDINNAVDEILKKPVAEVTQADKEILRQYTGKGGLSLEESKDAGAAMFNQHYTDYSTIKAIFNALDSAGIKYNRVLEPSVGSGNFIGMRPDAKWDAVDIDETNIEVVKRLYPQAKVATESYETFKGKGYDLIIGNVPFASFSQLARKHAALIQPRFKAIHNFFFAQSLNKVKDGGVIAFMTSTGTMDGSTEAWALRKHLMSEADVIGAYRLPMGTQKANASTDVMIDIIFLQKRPSGVVSKQQATNDSFIKLGSKDGNKMNQYFIDNPKNILGDLSVGTNMYGREGFIVTGEARYDDIAIKPQTYNKKVKNVKGKFANREEAQAYADANNLTFSNQSVPYFELKNETTAIVADKAVSFSEEEGSGLFGHEVSSLAVKKLALLQRIEDTHDVALIKKYQDTFTKAPHKDRLLISSAKSMYADKKLKQFLSLFDDSFNPSEIFSSKVRFEDSGKLEITADSPLLDRAEAAEDAEGVIKEGAISQEETQHLLDTNDYARVSPTTIQNARLYYAGNIYNKLDALGKVKPAAQRNKQKDRLNKVLPAKIPMSRITVSGKEAWLPASVRDMIGYRESYDGTVVHGSNLFPEHDLRDIYNNYVNNSSLVKKGKDELESSFNQRVKDAQELLKKDILPRIKHAIHDNGLDQEVEDVFNRRNNFFAAPVFNGSTIKNLPTTFRGKKFTLMQHQQEGLERLIYNKRGVLAFAPGLGKTPTAIIAAKQLLDRGVMKKPLFIVPANTIPQWEETARELYPNSKIFEFPRYVRGVNKGKVKPWAAMNAVDKETMVNNLSNNRYDFTFISMELSQKFTLPANDMRKYVRELLESISTNEKSDYELTKSQIRAKESRLAKLKMLETTLMSDHAGKAREGFDMARLGFDAIIADEVQNYKNIGMLSSDVRGGLGKDLALIPTFPKGADGKADKNQDPIAVNLSGARAYDFRFKTQYISRKNNGNNIILLTGTPTPNKPLELMTLLHHLDTKILEEYGVNSVNDFVDEFLEVGMEEDVRADGSVKQTPALQEIKNIESLNNIIKRYVDYRSPESAKDLTRPEQIDIVHQMELSDEGKVVFGDIQARLIKSIEAAQQKRQGNDVESEEIIQMYGAGRDASIDLRLYKPTSFSDLVSEGDVFKDEQNQSYSKIAKTVALVAEQVKKDSKSGQIIFLDRLKFANTGGSTHEDIRNKILKATNLKETEVVFVNGGMHVNPITGKVVKSGAKPERLQGIIDAYNSGEIRVIIGNTPKLGVGVDLQVNTTDIYQLDKPYRPDEIEQRINRGVRQGNRYSSVRSHTFDLSGSFDELSNRIIDSKKSFNEVYWGNTDSDVVDVSNKAPSDPFEAAIALEQDPIKKQKLIIEHKISNSNGVFADLSNTIKRFNNRIAGAERSLVDIDEVLAGLKVRQVPRYDGMNDEDRAKAIREFHKRNKETVSRNLIRKDEVNDNIKKIESDKLAKENELKSLQEEIKQIRDMYMVEGEVSLDLIKENGAKFSKGAIITGQTVAQTEQSLIKQFGSAMKRAIKNGKVVVHRTANNVPDAVKRMTAWHGSPHDHNRFTTDAIGTGEGAQAYGYGLYFAGNKDVAEWYREKLTAGDGSDIKRFYSSYDYDDDAGYVSNVIDELTGTKENFESQRERAFSFFKNKLKKAKQRYADTGKYEHRVKKIEKSLQILNEIDYDSYNADNKGRLYEVDLKPSEDEYLLWDKPLSEQSDKVKQALKTIGINEDNINGKNIYSDLKDKAIDGYGLFKGYPRNGDKSKNVSKLLHSIGIRGIKYLDGSSRQVANYHITPPSETVAGDWMVKGNDYLANGVHFKTEDEAKAYITQEQENNANYNFVVFDEADISITAKYSKNGAIQGWTDKDGTVHIVAENNDANTLASTLLHESLHSHLDGNSKAKANAFKQLDRMRKMAGKRGKVFDWIKAAEARAEAAGTKPEHLFDEYLSYAVTNYENAPSSIKKWVDTFIGEIRAFLIKQFGLDMKITPATLRGLARQHIADMGKETSQQEGLSPVFRSMAENHPAQSKLSENIDKVAPEETLLQKTGRVWQDKMVRFAVIRDWVAEHGKALSEAADVWMHEGNMHGKIAAATEDFREIRMKDIIQSTQKAGFKLSELAEYMEMRHIPEANARMRKIHKDQDATANGITDEEAIAITDKYEAMANFNEFSALTDKVDSIIKDTRNMYVKRGIISKDMADSWSALYKHYVPLKGIGDNAPTGTGAGLSVNGKQKKRLGHGTREEAVLQNIFGDHERAIMVTEKNTVGMALIRMAIEMANPNIITVNKPVKKKVLTNKAVYAAIYDGNILMSFPTKKEASDFINGDSKETGRNFMKYDVEVSYDPMVAMMASPMLAENEANVYIDGYSVRVQLNDSLLARAYKNLGIEHLGMVLAAGRSFNAWLSKAYTGYNPEFALVNMARDYTAGIINLSGDYGITTTTKIYKNYGKALKELFKHFVSNGDSAIVNDYRASGGNTGASYLPDAERIGLDMTNSFNEFAGAIDTYNRVYNEVIAEGGSKGKARIKATAKAGQAKLSAIPVVGHFLTVMQHVNALTENALRVATYMTLTDKGIMGDKVLSKAKAAQAAKRSTVNFNRKGEVGAQAGAMFLFFNPNVQGTERILTTLFKGEHKNQAKILVGMMALAGYSIAEAMRGDDEDRWAAIPDFIKDRNIVTFVGEDMYLMPIPYGYGIFHVLGNVMSDAAHGEDLDKLGIRLAEAMFENFSPPGNPIPDGNFSPLQIMPTAIKMALGVNANENGFGRPIQPIMYSKYKPDSENQYRKSKGSLYESVAKGMNELTYGNSYTKGYVDVSPESLRFWVESLTGGAGKFVVDSVGLASIVAHGASPELREIPIVRKFAKADTIANTRGQFWRAVDEVRDATNELKGAKKYGADNLNDIKAKIGFLAKLSKRANKEQKKIKKKRDYIDDINADDDLTLNDKRLRIKQVEIEERKLYLQFLSKFKLAKDRHKNK